MTAAQVWDLLNLLGLFAGFAIFVSLAKLLLDWEHDPSHGWQGIVGRIMVSIIASWVTGLGFASSLRTDPALIVLVLGAAWLPLRVMDAISQRVPAPTPGRKARDDDQPVGP